MPKHSTIDVNKETELIHREESLYPYIEQGNLKPSTAHFLATHPDALRNWKEDQLDLQRFYP